MFGFCKALAWLGVAGLIGSAAFADEGSLFVPDHKDAPVTVEFAAGSIDWETSAPADLLQVFVGPAGLCCDGKTPIAGRHARQGDTLTFTPAFGFVAGQDYTVRVPGAEALATFNLPPKTPVLEPAVTGIYPSGDVLPENVLRFYIHFSVPMKPHVAFDYIKLRDASGKADEAAFMKFKQELWNEDRTRLTVLIDPGRIKRNVATNLELGPALHAGRRYALSVGGGWPTADGTSVLSAFSKPFGVSGALRERPNTDLWQIAPPRLRTLDPLRIRFDRPFDQQLLQKHIGIFAEDGERITGRGETSEDERVWSFTPDTIWTEKEAFLRVNTVLEDVAGNNFRDLLDHKIGSESDDKSTIVIPIQLAR